LRHVCGVDLLGARQRPPQRRQVELAGSGLSAESLRQQVVGEVGCRGHRAGYLSISLTHNSASCRKSIGVILTSSTPKYIGTARNPVIPISWKHGSQLTITSLAGSTSAPANIASALATKLRWLI